MNRSRILGLVVLVFQLGGCAAEHRNGWQPPAGFAIIHPIDQGEMVWVPGGYFRMGLSAEVAQEQAEQLGYKDYHELAGEESFPEREVFVEGFYMDKYEVTALRWKGFIDANPKWRQEKYTPTWMGPELDAEAARMPIGNITWRGAQEYANWAGKQLPTEAMWEKAARGTDGRWYPWGNEKPDPARHGVLSLDKPLLAAQAVGSFPAGASPYGCMDMAGNVYEWTSEWMEPYPNCPKITGPWGHRYVVARGGCYAHVRHPYRTAKRMGFEANESYPFMGFRTAWYPPADFDHRRYAARDERAK